MIRVGDREDPARIRDHRDRYAEELFDCFDSLVEPEAPLEYLRGIGDVAVGAAESGRDTLMFLTKEAVRLATNGTATGTGCDGCPPVADLMKRYEAVGVVRHTGNQRRQNRW